MNEILTILFIVVAQHNFNANDSVWEVRGEGFNSMAACQVARKEYHIDHAQAQLYLPTWEREEPQGSFCCVVGTKSPECQTSSALALSS